MSAAGSGMPSTMPGNALAGRRVIVTRPAAQAGAWVDQLNRRGVPAVAVPLIGIDQAADPAAIDAVWSGLTDYQLLMFVSPNAAARFFARRPEGASWPASVQVASPGPGTTDGLLQAGVPRRQLSEPAADAAQFDSETLWTELRRQSWRGSRVLIVRGEGGRGWLAEQLVAAGAEVQFLAAYRRAPARLMPAQRQALQQALTAPAQHLWFFSSSEAVGHLLDARLLPESQVHAALTASVSLVTHPRIAERARRAGFGVVWECRPSLDAVVACIQSGTPPDDPGAPRPVGP